LHRIELAVAVLATLLAASPLAADVLVLRDGSRVTTQGPWQEKGRLVVFRDSAGRLSSLPVAGVDLAGSRAASAPSEAVASEPGTRSGSAATAPAPAGRKPAAPSRVFTDEQYSKVDPATLAAPADSATPAPRVTLYSTTWCGWCRKTRALLASLGVAFTEKDVESDPAAEAESIRKAGRPGVPVLDIGGTIVVGYNEARIRALVKRRS
jgi:glutaredoxin